MADQSQNARRTVLGSQTVNSFSPYSRYARNATVYRDQANEALKLDYQRPTILPDDSDTLVEVLPEETWRPDLLAARVYGGRHQLTWVLQVFNSMFHVREFQAGTLVRVPSLIRLQGTIL
jgi:hypothetical protein